MHTRKTPAGEHRTSVHSVPLQVFGASVYRHAELMEFVQETRGFLHISVLYAVELYRSALVVVQWFSGKVEGGGGGIRCALARQAGCDGRAEAKGSPATSFSHVNYSIVRTKRHQHGTVPTALVLRVTGMRERDCKGRARSRILPSAPVHFEVGRCH